jgi:hypothetical protein
MGAALCCCEDEATPDIVLRPPSYEPVLCISVACDERNLLLGFGEMENAFREALAHQQPPWRPRLCESPGFVATSGPLAATATAHDSQHLWDTQGFPLPEPLPTRKSLYAITLACRDGQGPPTSRDAEYACDLVTCLLTEGRTQAAMRAHPLRVHACWIDQCKAEPLMNVVRQCWTMHPVTRVCRAHTHASPSPMDIQLAWARLHE